MNSRPAAIETTFRLRLTDQLELLSVGDRVEPLLGIAAGEFLSSRVTLIDRIHLDDHDYASFLFSPSQAKRSGSLNLRVRHADGKIRCMRAVYERTKRGGDEFLDLTLQDAKSLWQGIADLAHLTLFQALMTKTEEIIYFKDRNHVFTAASKSMLETVKHLFGGDPAGLTDYDLLPEADADAFYRPEKEVFAGAGSGRGVQAIAMQSGRIHWMDYRKYPLEGPDGSVVGLFTIARDITDRIQAESALCESEAALRESQRIAGIGSYVFDVRADEWTGTDVMDDLFGIERRTTHTPEEWQSLIHPAEREAVSAYLRRILAEGKVFDREYRIVRHADQAVRWMHGLGKIHRDDQGQPQYMIGTIRDITEQKQAEIALQESKKLLQLFIERAPAALAMFDDEMRYLAVSARWLRDYGLAGMDVIGRSHYDLFPEIPERWKDVHRRGLAGEPVREDEDRFERADGSVQWVRWEMLPWRSENGTVGGIVIFAEEITQTKLAQDRLKLTASVFQNASEAIVIADLAGTILEVNDAFTRVTGYTREEVQGANPRILKSGLHGKDFYDELWRSIHESGHWRGEFWNRRKNGDLFAAASTISTVYDAQGKPQSFVAVFSDITPIKEQEQKLARLAHYDALTGLPNRTLLAEELRKAMAEAAPDRMLAVAYFDLDHFKAVNDRLGKEAGDAVLTAVAARMKQELRPGDMLARISGDEFVAVLRDLDDADDATPILAALHRTADEAAKIGDFEWTVSASAGVVFYPQSEDVDADQLLRQANHAMYQAKLAGKNRYHIFDVSQDQSVRMHHDDIEHVRRALASREFELFYQPKVNMAKGTMVGAEALLRWQHPQWGLLSPGLFLPIIENHSLAVNLGEWVIDTALLQMERWNAMGLEVPVSVNLFARHLQDPEFVNRLRALLAGHPAIQPSSLELELLETSALMDVAQVSQLIAECRELGVSVALDDFGTGYSSLTYLKRLPANVLKIDQSFVRDMLTDPDDLAILEGVLGLAMAFRRDAIAEGVETVDQGLLLLQMGCELAQGYGIARPMPGEELPKWASSWQPDPRWRSVLPVSQADLPLLYAGTEHRAWVNKVGSFLKNERGTAPALGEWECRMGAWLQTARSGPRGTEAGFHRIGALHRQLHEMADEAVRMRAAGRTPDGLARLAAIDPLLIELVERLNSFVGG